jgi:hypothetical protein
MMARNLTAVGLRRVREHGSTRLGGVAPAAYLRDQPVSEHEAATAVEVEPVDTRVADDDSCGTFDHRLLREGEFCTPGEHLVEAVVRSVGREHPDEKVMKSSS